MKKNPYKWITGALALVGAFVLIVIIGGMFALSAHATDGQVSGCLAFGTPRMINPTDPFVGPGLPAGAYTVDYAAWDEYPVDQVPSRLDAAQSNEQLGIGGQFTADVPDTHPRGEVSGSFAAPYNHPGGSVVVSHVGGDGPGSVSVLFTICPIPPEAETTLPVEETTVASTLPPVESTAAATTAPPGTVGTLPPGGVCTAPPEPNQCVVTVPTTVSAETTTTAPPADETATSDGTGDTVADKELPATGDGEWAFVAAGLALTATGVALLRLRLRGN